MKKRFSISVGPILCWASALIVILVCGFLVGYPLVKGIHAINLKFLLSEPEPSLNEALSGGILTPIGGTVILTLLGIAVTAPLALGTAIYLVQYMREERLMARLMRVGIDVLAGVPSIVFAIFGLAIFSLPQLAFLSSKVEGADIHTAFGRSFIIGGIVMAAHVLSYVIKVMEEAIKDVPEQYGLAAYALGATRWRVIKRAILPSARPGLITAIILGMGLIAGDTAIVWLCVGGSMTMTGSEHWWLPWHWLDTIRHTGSTLTTYVYYSSPAGEGNSPGKAFGAAFVLMFTVLALNLIVDFVAKPRKAKEALR